MQRSMGSGPLSNCSNPGGAASPGCPPAAAWARNAFKAKKVMSFNSRAAKSRDASEFGKRFNQSVESSNPKRQAPNAKHQIPSSNPQRSSKFKFPNSLPGHLAESSAGLVLGI